MCRLLSILLLSLFALNLQAQSDSVMMLGAFLVPEEDEEETVAVATQLPALAGAELMQDSALADTVLAQEPVSAVVAEKPEIPEYMLRSVMRSWRRTHPIQPLRRGQRRGVWSGSVSHMLDSLRLHVRREPGLTSDMRYLYDMRLPVISAGYVPSDSIAPLYQIVSQDEDRGDRVEFPVGHHEDLYTRQLLNEEVRHLARFNYASADPRRFRYARREFIVPTNESRTLDSRSTVQNTRVADDIDINFGNASLESFDQFFQVKADRWHWKGDHSLTMQQTALSSNWYNGGDNNMSVSGEQKLTVTRYDEDSKVTFETVLDLKLSGYYTKADTIHRMRVSDNEFTLNMKYGYKAWKKWYYSAQLYAKTPVFDFYNANSTVCKSTFLSPLEMNLALGVDYQYTSPKKKFTYSLLLAPLSYDMKYVSDPRVNVTSFKIKEGDHSLHNFGSTVTTKFDWKMGPNATWSSRLYYFTTYHAMKVEFENTFNFKISRFFTARVYVYPRFDDTSDTKAEVKEMLTVGFSYAW